MGPLLSCQSRNMNIVSMCGMWLHRVYSPERPQCHRKNGKLVCVVVEYGKYSHSCKSIPSILCPCTRLRPEVWTPRHSATHGNRWSSIMNLILMKNAFPPSKFKKTLWYSNYSPNGASALSGTNRQKISLALDMNKRQTGMIMRLRMNGEGVSGMTTCRITWPNITAIRNTKYL